MNSHRGFEVGDYVIADKAKYDSFDKETWVIVSLGYNLIGQSLVHVIDITTLRNIKPTRTCFFPEELSYEDGSQPD